MSFKWEKNSCNEDLWHVKETMTELLSTTLHEHEIKHLQYTYQFPRVHHLILSVQACFPERRVLQK